DEHSLASRDAVGLDDLRPHAAVLEIRLRRTRSIEPLVRCARNAMPVEQLLREHFRALEARTFRARSEHPNLLRAQLVRQTVAQRILGTDDDEIDALAERELHEPSDVFRVDGYVARDFRGACVARCAQYFR